MRSIRKYHRWIGLTTSLFLFVLATTGFILHHQDWFSFSKKNTDAHPQAPQGLFINPKNNLELYLKTKPDLFYSSDGGAHFQPVFFKYPSGEILCVEFDHENPDKRMVAFYNGKVLYSSSGGLVWDDIHLPSEINLIKDFRLGSHETWYVLTEDSLFLSHDLGRNWTQNAQFLSNHNFSYWVYRIHTGQLFPPLVIVYDFAALGLIFLACTGIYLGLFVTKRN